MVFIHFNVGQASSQITAIQGNICSLVFKMKKNKRKTLCLRSDIPNRDTVLFLVNIVNDLNI